MNIVKGVADLIRRTSGGHDGDSSSGTQAQKFSPPGLKICFSEVGDEAVLNILWDRYEKAVDKVEKRRLFHVFLKQFLDAYENWEPVNTGQMSEASSTTIHSTEYSSRSDDVVIGCFAGHPAEVILVLTEEIRQLTSMVAELNTSTVGSSADFSGHSATLNIISEGMPLLDALLIVIRSLHNCRVFGYYGAVVQLKTISGALSADEKSSNPPGLEIRFRVFGYHGGIQKLMALMKGEKPLAMRSFKDTEVKLPRPTTLENKTPAPVQITAEQTLREAYGHQEADIQLPKQEITDPTELANHCPQNCKEYEDRVRVAIAAFLKHCKETDGIPKGRAEDLLDTRKLNKRMPIVTEAGLAGHEEWQKQQVKQHGTTIILVVLPHHVLIAADSRLTSYTYEIQRRPQHLKICELSFSKHVGCTRKK